MPAKKTTPRKPKAKAQNLPGWIETPQPAEYRLTMIADDEDSDPYQTIDLSRDEYLALKQHLAKLRGLKVSRAAG